MRPVRISIFGSCVSRDTLEYAHPERFELKRYLARQSLVSAFDTHGTYDLDLSGMTSDFQRRMAEWDLRSEFAAILPTIAADSDLLLMDLTDERLGFYEMPDGSVVTRSVDLIGAGIDPLLQQHGRHVRFGTIEHYRRWRTALDDFGEAIAALGLRNRVRMLAVPWASRDSEGAAIDYNASVSIKTANRVFPWYIRAAKRIVPTLTVAPRVRVRGSQEHRWGLAPFHYEDSVYKSLVAGLGLPLRK